MQLAVADVDGDDTRGAALQQDVGEAAGRGADVETVEPRRIDAELVERMRELLAAARDVLRAALTVSSAVSSTCCPGLSYPGTSPAITSACACARDSARPRSTRRTSSRFLATL